MVDPSERELAWQLAEHHQGCLSTAERHTVFIHLGIEDYPPAIVCVLAALARGQYTVPESTLRHLRSWMMRYHQHAYADLISRIVAHHVR